MRQRPPKRSLLRRALPGATLCLGLALLAVAPILLPLALLAALAVIAHQTTPPQRPQQHGRTILAGVAGYPAACAILYFLLKDSDLNVLDLAIFALPALVLGTAIPRLWTILVPIAAAALFLGIAYLHDPNCANCGEDTWSYGIAITLLYFVAPAVFMTELGILLRNLITGERRKRRSCPSRTS